ncbi:hypothetical protein [Ruegeria sp.]|uniref:hypothetical protein n=1 Tax=Ruegeria sp. TaxID=1879320 RepID=UPI003B0090BD
MVNKTPYLENHITKQIQEVDIKINELKSERAALERLLLKARQDEAQEREPIRRNSVNRVLVENRILDALRRSNRTLSNRDLFFEAKSVVYDLKDSTFRSHIKRLKDGGKIVSKGSRWTLPEKENTRSST